MVAMTAFGDRRRRFAWEATERVVPVADVVPKYKKIRADVNAGTPVVLTDGGTRIAVIVGWDLWTLQHERYLYAAAMSWAFWRNGRFDAAGFGWEVLAYLRPPMQERLHPTVQLGEDGGPDEQPG
jgi:antitoxin (DNA-binding transcriptional repressor) of toxin-antitoxin stability system